MDFFFRELDNNARYAPPGMVYSTINFLCKVTVQTLLLNPEFEQWLQGTIGLIGRFYREDTGWSRIAGPVLMIIYTPGHFLQVNCRCVVENISVSEQVS